MTEGDHARRDRRDSGLGVRGLRRSQGSSATVQGAYPVPTYVGEFLIGRYCATTDPEEIEEGLQVVRRLLADRTVRAGEEDCSSHALASA